MRVAHIGIVKIFKSEKLVVKEARYLSITYATENLLLLRRVLQVVVVRRFGILVIYNPKVSLFLTVDLIKHELINITVEGTVYRISIHCR